MGGHARGLTALAEKQHQGALRLGPWPGRCGRGCTVSLFAPGLKGAAQERASRGGLRRDPWGGGAEPVQAARPRGLSLPVWPLSSTWSGSSVHRASVAGQPWTSAQDGGQGGGVSGAGWCCPIRAPGGAVLEPKDRSQPSLPCPVSDGRVPGGWGVTGCLLPPRPAPGPSQQGTRERAPEAGEGPSGARPVGRGRDPWGRPCRSSDSLWPRCG